jgi:hypothetical protein
MKLIWHFSTHTAVSKTQNKFFVKILFLRLSGIFDLFHEHDNLPGLTWASDDNRWQLSQSISRFIEWGLLSRFQNMRLDSVSEDILFLLSNIDFRYWDPWSIFYLVCLCRLVGLSPSHAL